MNNVVRSLHARLLIVIILPLLLIVAVMTIARYYEAQETSQKIYDNALVSIAHVVVRDVVLSSGDLLAKRLLDTLTNALEDRIFYHVIGENSPTLLSGYTPPPHPPDDARQDLHTPTFFDAHFRSEPVRVVMLREYMSISHYEGWVTVTVWQNTKQRQNLSFSLAARALSMMALMIIATALCVWFGVNHGLKPLFDLQQAIEKRSPDDISPIKRAVPREIATLVVAMNQLFWQLRESFAAKDAFIANAAHQIRNPIAGLLSQAEAAERTDDPVELKSRVTDVAEAARRTARLTQQLLAMERVTQSAPEEQFEHFNIVSVVRETLAHTASRAFKQQVEISLTGTEAALVISGNPTLIGEVLDNLLDNSLRYGCPDGGNIEVHIEQQNSKVLISLKDDGAGIPDNLLPHIFERFTRGTEDGSSGCGLGLAIARSIAEKHGGRLQFQPVEQGTLALLTLPLHSHA